jgi:hypothetical protein
MVSKPSSFVQRGRTAMTAPGVGVLVTEVCCDLLHDPVDRADIGVALDRGDLGDRGRGVGSGAVATGTAVVS